MNYKFCYILGSILLMQGCSEEHNKIPTTYRKPEYPINNMFYQRWSPRAMSGEPISKSELMSLFEAARWAPSSFNAQPWRFIYAMHGSQAFDTLFNFLVEFNQEWCKNAAALVVVVAKKTYDSKNYKARSFDTGAACENLALQGYLNNLVVHMVEGFDAQKARASLNIPDTYTIEVMIAIGKPGNKKDLPAHLQEREIPSDRKPLSEIVLDGEFKEV